MSKLKPLIALYKAYRGGEWFEASLSSIKNQCDGAVVILSDQPWSDVKGEYHLWGNCKKPLSRFTEKNPEFRVIVEKPKQRQNTEEQYKLGMELIRQHFGETCGVLLIDTDEIWEDKDLVILRETMAKDTTSLCFTSGIYTYLRSPLWQVYPKEQNKVSVALAYPYLSTGQSRLSNITKVYARDRIRDVACSFHHFGYVRDVPEEITSKLANTASQDKVPNQISWKERVWDKLPLGKNIHPQMSHEKCWEGVREIRLSTLPKVVTCSDAFWAGLVWHSAHCLSDLFTWDDKEWRSEVDKVATLECPELSTLYNNTLVPTTVTPNMIVALSRLTNVLGKGSLLLGWLIPKLRMAFREVVQLALLTNSLPPNSSILEIGSGLGGSIATMMLASNKDTNIIAIDPYVPYDEDNLILNKDVIEGSVEEFHDTVNRTLTITKDTKVNLIRKSSSDASPMIEDNSLDLLLVDGNHSYLNCKEDLDLWYPKLKTNGILLVHDYAPRFPGVMRAVRSFENEHNITFNLPTRSTLAWLRKDIGGI